MDFFSKYHPHITALCEKHKVRKLFAFGSVLTNRFTEKSDIDLVEEQTIRNPYPKENIDTKKHLRDILTAIKEIESFLDNTPKQFDSFVNNIYLRRAVERNIKIIREAMNRILKTGLDIKITNAFRPILNKKAASLLQEAAFLYPVITSPG